MGKVDNAVFHEQGVTLHEQGGVEISANGRFVFIGTGKDRHGGSYNWKQAKLIGNEILRLAEIRRKIEAKEALSTNKGESE